MGSQSLPVDSMSAGTFMSKRRKADYETSDDAALAILFTARDPEALRVIATRNNQRLFRTAWSILRNHAEAEDVIGHYDEHFALGLTTPQKGDLVEYLKSL